jgi:AraC family transcriptional regulator of adaptative response/methylated-DNA-[protein]-cysteine methyltransferase
MKVVNKMVIMIKTISTPLGDMIAVASQAGLCLLEFSDRAGLEGKLSILQKKMNARIENCDHPHLLLVSRELQNYLIHPHFSFTVPLDLRGTYFEKAVWQQLFLIPTGETRTYRQIAAALGKPRACRAVGHANGSNPVAVIVPCHRVVGSDGTLHGYGGGLWRKKWLLEHEAM